ncbi:MAG TPA: ATP phosphoribosyltransferase [Atribacteraceae bacterium]|nr:ATP phosphoribosyltransferase [Atribacteraceae bacterium]
MSKLTVSVPTGRLKEESLSLLARLRTWPAEYVLPSRRLVVETSDLPWRIMFSHPKDSSIYVEFGAADLGIVGKDILLERENEVYELMDLGIGRCTMVIAGPEGLSRKALFEREHLRIATKYPSITQRYLSENGVTGDLVYLYGSIELAPAIGLADAIVDIVSTGKTLRENHLRIIEEIGFISARLVANRISIKTRNTEIAEFCNQLNEVIEHA